MNGLNLDVPFVLIMFFYQNLQHAYYVRNNVYNEINWERVATIL
jgi:hypothetical protein